ncbi:MAG TPA: lysophospholipid acyltransferase family protein [Verrucomicrobiae bacterium]|nr:lysophospholipid acyltransferase family protein [Verrucomicrobiae bacterium]
MRRLIGLALGFYFRRIERFHIERVPASGPVLFVSNHPNSLTDSFVIGASVPRKVNFIGTVQLFSFKPVKWLLTQCGVIPINRLKDNPKAMRSVADTFEAVYAVLERGEAVGIFPEGVTYDDSALKEVKSGAARMALELEHRHGGKLGLRLVPVGLTYSAKEIYRSDALANFGEPIVAADFIEDYAERRKECIVRLTEEIERRIQSLILHLPKLEEARVVEGVKRLYFDRLLLGNQIAFEAGAMQANELMLSQKIAETVDRVYRTEPERAAAFAVKLDFYERWLARLKISDEALKLFPQRKELAPQAAEWTFIAVVGAPIAFYGWVHRLIPYALIKWSTRKFTMEGKRKAQASTTAIAAGVVGFGVCYAVYIALVQWLFGWPASLWYGLSLAPTGLLAHYYLREIRRLWASVQATLVLLRTPFAARRLLTIRAELISEIESVRT